MTDIDPSDTPSTPEAGIPENVQALLEKRPLAFVGTVRPDGDVSIVPVSPMFDGHRVWFSARDTTRKIRNLQAHSRVTLTISDPANPTNYVQIRGHAIISPDTDRSKVNELARFYMGVEEYPYDRPGQQRVVVTIVADRVVAPSVHGS